MVTETKIIKVFIGRVQPPHNEHVRVLRASIATADHTVAVIGSINKDPSTKNPFTFEARKSMLEMALTPLERQHITVVGQDDVPGDDSEWVASVKANVKAAAAQRFPGAKFIFTLVGCHKGSDTYYLKLYKGWRLELVPQVELLNATDIRNAFFEGQPLEIWAKNLPPSSATHLAAFKMYQESLYLRLCIEYEEMRHAKAVDDIERRALFGE
ncbi:cytidylyltransferase [Myxococcus phage Mx1]|nr:cytidylyltransferase [Myxococcus phage Mx1]